MLYVGEFKSINDTLYEIKIVTQNDESQQTNLLLANDPVTISLTQSDDTIFPATQLKSATINIVLHEPYFDIFSITKDGTRVQILDKTNDKLIFNGYTVPNIYDQGYSEFYDNLEIECVETVSILKYIKYSPINGLTNEIVSFKSIIDKCMEASSIQTYYVQDVYRLPDTSSFIDQLYIDENNFFDDDDEKSPWKLDEVLQEICKFSGLTFYTEEDEGFFVDKSLNKKLTEEEEQINYYKYTVASNTVLSISKTNEPIEIEIDNWSGTGTNLSLEEIYNEIKVTANTYPVDEELPDVFDNFRNLYIVNTTYPNNKDRYLPYHQVFVRVAPFTTQNFKCYFYSPLKYNQFPSDSSGWLVPISDAITPTIPDSEHRNGEIVIYDPIHPGPYPGDDISDIGCKVTKHSTMPFLDQPSSLEFKNQLWFSLGIGYENATVNETESTTHESSYWNADFFKKSYFPVFLYKSDMNVMYHPDLRSYIMIQGNIRDVHANADWNTYAAYPNGGLETYEIYKGEDHDDEKTSYTRIPYKLKVGNKVFLGNSTQVGEEPIWGDESLWAGQTYLEVYQDNLSFNTSYPIRSNVNYFTGLEEDGHAVYISSQVSGKMELTLYRPYFYDWAYINTHIDDGGYYQGQVPRWVVFENFKVKFLQVDRNYNYLEEVPKDSQDTEYTNIINEECVAEWSEIELKINTQNGSKPQSYSSVMYDDNGIKQFVTEIYSVEKDSENIQENNLVEKNFDHYSKRNRIITGSLDKFYKPTDIINWREYENMTVQEEEWSLHYDKNQVKITEI